MPYLLDRTAAKACIGGLLPECRTHPPMLVQINGIKILRENLNFYNQQKFISFKNSSLIFLLSLAKLELPCRSNPSNADHS